MKKECPICHREFTGRSDKRFCSISCKNAHHNSIWKEELTRQINQALLRNKSILQQLIPTDSYKTVIDRAILENLGFRFSFMTGISHSQEGNLIRMVYNFCWSEISATQVQIERISGEIIDSWKLSVLEKVHL